jgi:hypothetical protein
MSNTVKQFKISQYENFLLELDKWRKIKLEEGFISDSDVKLLKAYVSMNENLLEFYKSPG